MGKINVRVKSNYGNWANGVRVLAATSEYPVTDSGKPIYISLEGVNSYAFGSITADEARDIAAQLLEAAAQHENAVEKRKEELDNPLNDLQDGDIFYAQFIEEDGSLYAPKYGPYRYNGNDGKSLALNGYAKDTVLGAGHFKGYKLTVIWPEPVND